MNLLVEGNFAMCWQFAGGGGVEKADVLDTQLQLTNGNKNQTLKRASFLFLCFDLDNYSQFSFHGVFWARCTYL